MLSVHIHKDAVNRDAVGDTGSPSSRYEKARVKSVCGLRMSVENLSTLEDLMGNKISSTSNVE